MKGSKLMQWRTVLSLKRLSELAHRRYSYIWRWRVHGRALSSIDAFPAVSTLPSLRKHRTKTLLRLRLTTLINIITHR